MSWTCGVNTDEAHAIVKFLEGNVVVVQARIYVAQTAHTIHPSDRFFIMRYVWCCTRTAETLMPSTLNGNQGAVKGYFSAP